MRGRRNNKGGGGGGIGRKGEEEQVRERVEERSRGLGRQTSFHYNRF